MFLRHRLPAAAACLACLALTLTAAAPAGAQTVQPSAVSGSIGGSVPSTTKGVVVVRAINASTGAIADTRTMGRSHRFNLAVPPGAYAIRATVVAPGRATREYTIPITVASDQDRKGLRFTVKKGGSSAKASSAKAPAVTSAQPTATRSYISADGTETTGVDAYAVEDFTGGSGDWRDLRKGIPALVQAGLQDGTSCPTQGILNARERPGIAKVSFRRSRLVASGTKVTSNLIVGDLSVTGKIKAAKGGASATVTVGMSNKRTGKVFDTVTGKLRTSHFAADQKAFAKTVAQRLCRRPKAYDLTLAVDGKATFDAYTATGRLEANLHVTQTGGAGGQPTATWKATGPLSWTKLAFQTKTACAYSNPVATAGTWTATLSSTADDQLTVDWAPSGDLYVGGSSATVACPGVPAAGGQPGPSLFGVLPNAMRLPLAGGVVPVSGNATPAGQGFVNSGTLTIKPVWD